MSTFKATAIFTANKVLTTIKVLYNDVQWTIFYTALLFHRFQLYDNVFPTFTEKEGRINRGN